MKRLHLIYPLAATILVHSCIDPIPADGEPELFPQTEPTLSEVALLLSSLPLDSGHLDEVHSAVTSSALNGYDEEYTMADLFTVPGAGVGDDLLSSM